MNDPGLDQPIDQAESQVKHKIEKPGHGIQDANDGNNTGIDTTEEEEEENFLMPTRWWYASTAFPLIAGTFGPMANAFSICALVQNWRVQVPSGGTEEHGIDLKDPRWLITVNAVSLVCALIANLSLLLNMAKRLSFNIAQPITILGFWIASILLIALIAEASTHPWDSEIKDQALTQAYYYAIFAACLYQFISYIMCVTVWGAFSGHYSKEFKLTAAQRTLMLQTISFLVYQHVWALAYSHIEGWKFLDAVYWADFTSLTIGIGGDFTPHTHLGRSLLFPFAIGGIVILGLVVGSIRSLVLDRGKKKIAARVTEKTRKSLVKQVLKNIENDKTRGLRWRGMNKDMATALTMRPDDHSIDEKDRREYEFEAMRKVQDVAARKRRYAGLFASSFAFAFLWTMGAFVFYKAEKNQQWSYFQSFYFAYTSLVTIGYGDFQPISNSGKPFFVFWSLLAIPTLTILISNMGDTVVKGVKDATIWLGEVTVLPSDEASVIDRLKVGFYRSTLRKVAPQKKIRDAEQADSDSGSNEYQELHPGLAKVFGQRRKNKPSKRERDTVQRMATDFEESEKVDEDKAKEEGDEISQEDHHYRRELLSQIRRCYADSAAPTPKKYTYQEWAYFLKLLGEDESDSRFHRRAPVNPKAGGPCTCEITSPGELKKQTCQCASQHSGAGAPGRTGTQDQDGEVFQWSWIGQTSPLMGDKDEADWLLEKLFDRLEESTREVANEIDQHRRRQKRDNGRIQNRREPSDSTMQANEAFDEKQS